MRPTLNLSKPARPWAMPVPDVHNAPPAVAAPVGSGGSYAAGFEAGARWAHELASFLDLERFEADAQAPYCVVPPYVRGFCDGALAVWHELATTTYAVN